MGVNTIITNGKARRGWPSRLAWAIECEPGQLIGVFWFNPSIAIADQMDGYRIATFSKRSKAREALKLVKGPADRGRYPKARVVRVRVCLDVATSRREGT